MPKPSLRSTPLPAWLLLVATLACATRARADAPDALETARRLFHEAAALEDGHEWNAAALKLREALTIKDTPGLRFHLAHCEEQSGELLAAERDYARATALIEGGAAAPDVEKLLPDVTAALKRRIPTLLIALPQGTVTPRVEIDGASVDSSVTTAQPLDPKEHRVVVSFPSGQRSERLVTLVEGEQRVLQVDPDEASAPASPPPTPASPAKFQANPSRAPRSDSTRAYVLIGESALALAGLGVGVVYAFERSSDTDRAIDAQRRVADSAMGNHGACSNPSAPLLSACHDFSAALDARQRDVTLETIGFVTAGVSASALAVSWLVWPSGGKQEQAARYRPWLGKDTIGIYGRF